MQVKCFSSVMMLSSVCVHSFWTGLSCWLVVFMGLLNVETLRLLDDEVYQARDVFVDESQREHRTVMDTIYHSTDSQAVMW